MNNEYNYNVEERTGEEKRNRFANKPLVPGSVVCSEFSDFDGNRTTGIFLVIYDEFLDTNVSQSRNVVALKLTTKNTLVNNYVVAVNRNINSFLDKDCMVCCSKLHVLSKVKEVYKYIGQLDNITYKRVVKTYSRWARAVELQVLDRI